MRAPRETAGRRREATLAGSICRSFDLTLRPGDVPVQVRGVLTGGKRSEALGAVTNRCVLAMAGPDDRLGRQSEKLLRDRTEFGLQILGSRRSAGAAVEQRIAAD